MHLNRSWGKAKAAGKSSCWSSSQAIEDMGFGQCLHTSCGLGPDKGGSILLHLWGGRVDAGPVAIQGVPTENMLEMVALLHSSSTSAYALPFPEHPCLASVVPSATVSISLARLEQRRFHRSLSRCAACLVQGQGGCRAACTFRSVTTVRRASGRPQGVSGPALLLENLPLASGLDSRLTWSEVWA